MLQNHMLRFSQGDILVDDRCQICVTSAGLMSVRCTTVATLPDRRFPHLGQTEMHQRELIETFGAAYWRASLRVAANLRLSVTRFERTALAFEQSVQGAPGC